MRGSALLVVCLATTACASEELAIPAPEGPPQGSLLVLETRPCNWLPAPDPNRCDAVGLVRIGLDGEVLEELAPEPPMGMRSMALSPDRTAVAWTWNHDVSVMGVDGDAPRTLTEKLLAENMGEVALDPTWSPDGSELLYKWSGANGEETWYVFDDETGDLVEVRMPVDCEAMAWAPDGTHVACEVWEGVEADLYLVNLETLDASELTDPDDGISNLRPDWSPDGRWLAFSRQTADDGRAADVAGIWVMEIETGEGSRVAAGELATPSWSPDGGHIIAFDDAQQRLVIMGRDGSELTVIDHEPRRFIGARWLPTDSR